MSASASGWASGSPRRWAGGDADAAGAASGASRVAEIITAATPMTAATATTLIATVQAARGGTEALSPRCR
ncbi:hypothetical protein HR12_15405 [Microbacterium sp. SUBG005]|nr:hypothetical protein HR12_15405 [Microbacterium sp. SUBG005]